MKRARFGLPKPVIALGGVSLLNDTSSEMLYPVLPLFLRQLGAPVGMIGLIEGIAETVASLLKLFSGWLADRFGRHRALAFVGYAISAFTRPIYGWATSPFHVLALRTTDRFGKGIRTAPRDAILASVVEPTIRGRAFGFHRAMDNLGAMVGPLLATLVLALASDDYRWVFWVSAFPAVLSLVLFRWGVPDVSLPVAEQVQRHPLSGARVLVRGRFGWFLLCLALFTLGRFPESFLLLRAQEAGVGAVWVPLLWAGLNGLRTVLAVPCGVFSDRFGHGRTLMVGWMLYALYCVGVGWTQTLWVVVGLLGVYAIYYGLSESAERALVAQLVPPEVRGQAYGVFHLTVGLGVLPASVIFGLLWDWLGWSVAFSWSAGLGLIASIGLMRLASSHEATE